MKIIKKAGENLLPRGIRQEIRPILAFRGAGRALGQGSETLVRLGWAALSDHLHGWERIGALAVCGYVTVYECAHFPAVARFAVPAAIVAWCVAAWWIAPPAKAPATPAAAEPTGAFVQWLLNLIGDRSGIHLRELYPAMRELPGHEDRGDAQLRAALKALGIPVTRSLRVAGVPGRSGVARADLEALPSPGGELPVDNSEDAGQNEDSPAVEPVGERLESA